ncbi:MAG: glycosyltransferase [Candidatus Gastranaerophilaceae bacterium]
MKNKIVFIAHSYHKKTRSCDFLVNYLKEFYEVEVFYDEFWETGKEINWEAFNNDYKAVIIWQMFPRPEFFKKITNNNVIYFPMYDHVKKWQFKKWYTCKNVKIISFSSTLHKKLRKWGFNSIYIQYFIKPEEFLPGAENEVFFWQRVNKIDINTVKKILGNSDFKIHIHKTVDPGQTFTQPAKEDEKRLKITYSEWFDTKEEMEKCIKSKGIYIAPRLTEGIGMSFLEAMAMGKLVIANDKPTMNEYIKNGKTGILCNFNFPKQINLSNIKEIQRNAYDYTKAGYEKWLVERKNIIHSINEPPKKSKLRLWTKFFRPFLLFDLKKIIRFKFGSNASLTLLGIKIFEL